MTFFDFLPRRGEPLHRSENPPKSLIFATFSPRMGYSLNWCSWNLQGLCAAVVPTFVKNLVRFVHSLSPAGFWLGFFCVIIILAVIIRLALSGIKLQLPVIPRIRCFVQYRFYDISQSSIQDQLQPWCWCQVPFTVILYLMLIHCTILYTGRAFNRSHCGWRHNIRGVYMCNVSLRHWTCCLTTLLNTAAQSANSNSTEYVFSSCISFILWLVHWECDYNDAVMDRQESPAFIVQNDSSNTVLAILH